MKLIRQTALLRDEPLHSQLVFGDAREPHSLHFANDLVNIVLITESIENGRVQFALQRKRRLISTDCLIDIVLITNLPCE